MLTQLCLGSFPVSLQGATFQNSLSPDFANCCNDRCYKYVKDLPPSLIAQTYHCYTSPAPQLFFPCCHVIILPLSHSPYTACHQLPFSCILFLLLHVMQLHIQYVIWCIMSKSHLSSSSQRTEVCLTFLQVQ